MMRVLRGLAFVVAIFLCVGGIDGVIGVVTGAPTQGPTAAFAGSLGMLALGVGWLIALTRTRFGRRSKGAGAFILGLYVTVLGVYTVWNCLVGFPQTYQRLQAHGVPATATLVECARGIGGGRGVGCRLSLDFRGFHNVWAYPENVGQFAQLPSGSTIPMLVDPQKPAIAYTVTDVLERTNAGVGPLTFVGVFFMLLGGGLTTLSLRRAPSAR